MNVSLWFAQVMSQSMVSGGYWRQAPAFIVLCVGFDNKKKEVVLQTTDTYVSTSWNDYRVGFTGVLAVLVGRQPALHF